MNSIRWIHIEEPGYNWGADYCFCDHCRQLCRQWFGLDLRKDPESARPVLHNLAAFMGTDFIARLRHTMTARRPELWLSANGSGGDNPDWYIGRDWSTWARRGYLDFYVPQLYTKDSKAFALEATKTKERLGGCDLITGMAVSWSGIFPERQEVKAIQAEISAAREVGADDERSGHIHRHWLGHVDVQPRLKSVLGLFRIEIRNVDDDNRLNPALDHAFVAGQSGKAPGGIHAECLTLLLDYSGEIIGNRVQFISAMFAEESGDPAPSSAQTDDAELDLPLELRGRGSLRHLFALGEGGERSKQCARGRGCQRSADELSSGYRGFPVHDVISFR